MWPWAAALIGGVGLLTGLGLWVESSVLAPKPTYQQRGVARARFGPFIVSQCSHVHA